MIAVNAAPPRPDADRVEPLSLSGMVTTEERKREVYRIAQEYDLIIVEDDPYYMLQYREGTTPALPGARLHSQALTRFRF